MVYSVVKMVVFLDAVKTLSNRLREDVSVMSVKIMYLNATQEKNSNERVVLNFFFLFPFSYLLWMASHKFLKFSS